jgi:hypothetical protein
LYTSCVLDCALRFLMIFLLLIKKKISIEHKLLYLLKNQSNETTNLPSIKYYWRQKIYKEEIFTKDQKMRAFSPAKQQNNNPSTHTLQPTNTE